MKHKIDLDETLFFLIGFFSLVPLFLFSLDTELMRKAEGFYKTEQYSQAESIYERLLYDPNLSPWERSIIAYNLGSVQLAKGSWEDALTLFNSVLSGTNQSPILKGNLYYNSALALLGTSQDLKNEYLQLELFYEILDTLDEAQASYCQAKLFEGYSQCLPSSNVVAVRSSVMQLIEDLEKKMKKTPINNEEREIRDALVVLDELMEGSQAKSINQEIYSDDEQMKEYYEKGLKYLNEGKKNRAKIFFVLVKQKLENQTKFARKDNELKPGNILQEALIKQQQAKKITQLVSQLKDTEGDKDLKEILLSKQKEVHKSSDLVLKSIVSAETQGYFQKRECQENPWDEVIPLYEDGDLLRNKSIESIENENLTQALKFQIETIKKWRAALLAMEIEGKPKKSFIETIQQKKTLDALTEMYQMDKVPQELKKVTPKIGQKPW